MTHTIRMGEPLYLPTDSEVEKKPVPPKGFEPSGPINLIRAINDDGEKRISDLRKRVEDINAELTVLQAEIQAYTELLEVARKHMSILDETRREVLNRPLYK